jgi:putative transposase
MLNATRMRIYPAQAQIQPLAVQFGCARWVFNNALELTQATYRKTGKGLSYHSLATRLPKLKKELEWLKEADSQVLQQSLQNLAAAFDGFFSRRTRYPRFKSRHHRQSIQYPQRVRIEGNRIYLPKVGWVKIVVHRPIEGRIKTVTVSREPCGHDYASVLTDNAKPLPTAKMPRGGHFTGIDVGLTDLAVTGKGQHIVNPRHLLQAEKNLKRKQRKLSRKQKGSNSRAKARRLVARAHERLKNTRKDFLHKLSRQLVDENQAIAVEDLCVKAMVKAPTLAKAVSDVGWGMLTRLCAYKCERVGKPFQRTDRFFPSSKLCHCCGHRCTEMPLSVRQWTCPGCGVVHDRDENAARNIGQEADRIWALGTRAPVGGGTVRHGRRRKLAFRASANEARSSGL